MLNSVKERLLVTLFLCITTFVNAQVDYDRYFTDKVLRFDFMLSGNSTTTQLFPIRFVEEPYYAGSRTNLIDIFGYGSFCYELFDSNNRLIFSKGFCTLYQEWQTTAEAKKMDRTFHEVAIMPYPKEKMQFVLSERKRNGSFEKIYETVIDPNDYMITHETPIAVPYSQIVNSGDPAKCVDIVFLAEGYTIDEMDKFKNDVKTMADILISEKPFSEYKDKINIWAVESPSQESGCDIPGDGIYKNTIFNSTFYTFDIDRYLTTFDIETVNDYAGVAPHDNIVILVNTSKYGGGVYNYYSITSADNAYSKKVFVHEIGHSFAGLADEYYTSDVAYQDYYPFDVEPWEANITTRVHFETKWEDMINDNIEGVGLVEGGGYSAKGIFRAREDCTMRSNSNVGFCPVCSRAISKMIDFYCN